jgi:hypothetical protein
MPNSTTLLTKGDQGGRRSASRKAWLVPLVLGIGALGVALVTRYVWIESTEIGLACSAAPAPWWCEPRYVVIRIHQLDGWGITALATGVLALLTRWYPLALVALVVGLLGLVLYNTGLAAVGLLAALLLILRR